RGILAWCGVKMGIISEIRETIIYKGIGILDPWVGSEQTKKEILAVLLSGRNLILEGPPGVGKTLLAKSTAQSLPDIQANDCSFNCEPGSIQCPQCRSEKKQVITMLRTTEIIRM
ncbi:MAG: ATP-binding protein, partial [Nitrospirota bacterium]